MGKLRKSVLAVLMAVAVVLCAPVMARADEYRLNPGVNILKVEESGKSFNIGEGQALMIANQGAETPIVFEGCTFNLAGGTVKISGNQEGVSYNNGETVTKLFVSGNVQFNNCTFVTKDGATKTTSAGYDAAIYFFSGDINLTSCKLSAEGYNGQFLGLYGSTGAVTFDHCDISTVGNKNGWSYAMYGGSVLKLINGSSMTATGSTTDSGNINAFYSGDNRTGYDAIYVDNSTIDFSDNHAGGFAINNVNIHVSNSSTITVNDNLGNACNSGYWIVDDSTIQMNGNKGGHGLSCIGFKMTNSTLDIEHNGYAGVYLQSKDSSLTNCTVDIACNGEKLLSYSAGDLWLQGHTLTVSDCTSTTLPDSAWLGAVGRTGAIETPSGSIVAHDLNTHTVDNLKSNCSAVLNNATITETDSHTLFLNPFMKSKYARGNAETKASNNDADLFADDNVTNRNDIIGAENAKIGTLTDADLAHHKYDWANGEVTDPATTDTYGVMRYACTLACNDYANRTEEHVNSFDCDGTYVYAPLVGVTFDGNVDDDSVTGLPDTQDEIAYNGTAAKPTADPHRVNSTPGKQWVFTGWYTDSGCTQPFDFSTNLTSNWTVLYAGWEEQDVVAGEVEIGKTANPTVLGSDFKTDVTLRVGSEQTTSGADVVFVLDKSTSTNVKQEALAMLNELYGHVKGSGLSVKVGVVVFNNNASNDGYVLPLTGLSEDTVAEVKEIFGKPLSSGTNIEAGIRAGISMLDSDTTVLAENKHLVLVTDGVTYLWGSDNPLTIYNEFLGSDNYNQIWSSNSTANSVVDKTFFKITQEDYVSTFSSPKEWMEKNGADIESFASSFQTAWSAEEGFTPNKFVHIDENTTGYISNDVAIYMAGKAWQDAADRGYNLYAYASDRYAPSDGIFNSEDYYPWASEFIGNLSTISGYSEIFNEDTPSDVDGMFNGVRDTILYGIENGTVTDIIFRGSVDGVYYDFDLTDAGSIDQDTFKLTVGGAQVSGVVDASNRNKVNFGEPNDEGVYPYSVEYQVSETGEETLVWKINVPVEAANSLSLTYSLTLNEKATDPGRYTNIPTNTSAVLDYESSNGGKGHEEFPVPEVEYTVPGGSTPTPTTGSLTVSKTVTGDLSSTDDAFTFRVTIGNLNGTYGGVKFTNGTAEFTLKGGQSITFTGITSGTSYAVTEVNSGDYKLVSSTNTSGTIPYGGTRTAAFTNDKSTPDELEPTDPIYPGGTKELTGRDLVAGEFTFRLTALDGAPMPDGVTNGVATVTNYADGTFVFGGITFDEAGTYRYTITEVAGSDENVTYDTSSHTLTVVVEDEDGDGKLDVTSLAYDGGSSLPVFHNSYDGPEEPTTPEEPEQPGTPEQPSTPEQPPVQPTEPSTSKPSSKVPDTGDHTSAVLPAVLVVCGVALAGGALAVMKRRAS